MSGSRTCAAGWGWDTGGMSKPAMIVGSCVMAGLLGGAGIIAVAGPLSPPAGVVASTHKTLTDVEPRTAVSAASTPGDADSAFRISQPGSYYLIGNVMGTAGRHGIEIDASGVTLDLNGFAVIGVAGSFSGVRATAGAAADVRVMNGTVAGWGGNGVDLTVTRGASVLEVTARACAGDGIGVGLNASLRGCVARGAGGDGISSSTGGSIVGCVASECGDDGIVVGPGSAASGCSSSQNGGDGITAGAGSTLSECAAYFNAGTGIRSSGRSVVTACVASSNTVTGISVLTSLVSRCVANNNGLDGIASGSHGTLLDNQCAGNGPSTTTGVGIRITGQGCRVEGNTLQANDTGILVQSGATRCVVVRNGLYDNTVDLTTAADNAVGEVVNFSGGGTMTEATGAWANIRY